MTTSETTALPGIGELLPQLMRAIGDIGKDRTNQHQRYNFRGIDDVLNHVGPACAALGVRCSVTVHDYSSNVHRWTEQNKERFSNHVTLRMRLEFIAPDGSLHVSEAIGEGIDTQGDKATNKAMSAAFKYACFMGLVIPVEGALDDSDNDGKQPDKDAKGGPPAGKKTPPPAAIDTVTIGRIRNLMDELDIPEEERVLAIGWAAKPRERITKLASLTQPEGEKLAAELEKRVKKGGDQ